MAAALAPFLDLSLPTPDATERLGNALAGMLSAPATLFLIGPLGVGKTSLARGFIETWIGRKVEAPSPTFTLVETYEGPNGLLMHMDLFRLEDWRETVELGVEEAFSTALCLIEWPERLGPLAPKDRLDIELRFADRGRTARIRPHGRWETDFDKLIARIGA